jgi:hypothetical protein
MLQRDPETIVTSGKQYNVRQPSSSSGRRAETGNALALGRGEGSGGRLLDKSSDFFPAGERPIVGLIPYFRPPVRVGAL